LGFIDQEVEKYAAQGLRTLVFGYKEVTSETIALFEAAHKERQFDLTAMKDWDWDELQV
jgi:magnesium-transporting ATPase (P-type)